MSKMLVKKMSFMLAYYFGLTLLFSFLNRKKITILAYHGVSQLETQGGIRSEDDNHLHVDKFARQIEYLVKHRKILSLPEAIDLLKEGRQIPPYSVVITFDDGYRSVFSQAWPVLRSYSVPATVFLSTRWIGTPEMLWFDKISYVIDQLQDRKCIDIEVEKMTHHFSLTGMKNRLAACSEINQLCKTVPDDTREKIVEQLCEMYGNCFDITRDDDYSSLSWDEVRELNGSSLISIGAHGDCHRILSKLSPEQSRMDISLSKQRIEESLGETTSFFAYPNGKVEDFNENTKQIIKELGFTCGLSTIPMANGPVSDPYSLGRICITNNGDFFDFQARLSGVAAFLSRLSSFLFARSRTAQGSFEEKVVDGSHGQ